MSHRGGAITNAKKTAGTTKREQQTIARQRASGAANARAQHTAKAMAELARRRGHNPHAFQGNVSHIPGLSSKAEAAVRAQLTHLRTSATPKVVVIDAKTGAVIDGNPRQVAAGQIVVRGGGRSPNNSALSLQEYEDVKSRLKPAAVVLAGREGMSVLRPGASGTWADYAHVKSALDQAFSDRLVALRAEQERSMRKSGTQTVRAALATVNQADVMNLAWKDAARATGMQYSRVGYSTRRTYEQSMAYDFTLDQIQSGEKTAEGRLGSGLRNTMRVGDIIHFTSQETPGRTLSVEVTGIHRYSTPAAMVNGEGMRALGFSSQYGDTKASTVDTYQRIFFTANPELLAGYHARGERLSQKDWTQLGVMSFRVKAVSADRVHEPLAAPKPKTTARSGTSGASSKRKKGS